MLIALDIETSSDRGSDFEIWRSDFKIDSVSLAFRENTHIVHWYSVDPDQIRSKIAELHRDQTPLVVHNLQFERTVLTKLYPEYPLNYHADTMRLAQLWDAGGAEHDMEPTLTLEQSIALELGETTEEELDKHFNKSKGLSLEACALRFLPEEFHNHKSVAHDWLRDNAGIKKGFGSNLHLLPPEVLEAYNNADTAITLALYEELTAKLGAFNWKKDWQLYTLRIEHMGAAYLRGIRIDQESLLKYILEIEAEIAEIERAFAERFSMEIDQVRDGRLLDLLEWANDPGLKSDRARAARFEAVARGDKDDEWYRFNTGSAHHLTRLFCGVLKLTPKFLTPKGAPSFKSSHLNQWSEGGEMLLKRKKRLLVLQQAANLYISALVDGRSHPQVRGSGTRTNRCAGGSL